jgi:APA family basic amino acid/polyamine antiporter
VWIAASAFEASHFSPFLPEGMPGVWAAAGAAFFAFIGFDTASTAAEEARDPQRDMPRAIIASVLVVLALYLAVAIAAIGARPPSGFVEGEPVLAAIAREVTGAEWAPRFIAAGAALSIFTVVLAVTYGQTRVTFAMARDGFLPRVFDRVDARHVPNRNIVLTAGFFALLAALVPIGPLLDVTVAGTFLACIVVHLGVLVRRRRRPDVEARFVAPLGPVVPLLGIACCGYLLWSLGPRTLLITAGILLVAGLVYVARFGSPTRRAAPAGSVARERGGAGPA